MREDAVTLGIHLGKQTFGVTIHPNGIRHEFRDIAVPAKGAFPEMREAAIREAYARVHAEWKKIGTVGHAYGTPKANALPDGNGAWMVFLQIDGKTRSLRVTAGSPADALKAAWSVVRKEREEAVKGRRWV